MDPGPHNDDNLYELTAKELKRRKIELLPANLLDATRHLEKDAVHPGGARQDRHRGLHRLLRQDQAGRVERLPRAGHTVGGQPLPDAVLRRTERKGRRLGPRPERPR